jgi:hypothetical protein
VSRPPRELQDDTVDALVDTVRELLTSEDGRTQSLLGRGSGLAGFAGLIVSLSGLIAREVVARDQVACYAYTAAGFLLAAIALLVATVLVVVLGILWPRSYDAIGMKEIER